METKDIQIKSTTLKVFSFLDRANLINKNEFIDKIAEDAENTASEGFAGFKDKEGFKSHLKFWVSGDPLKNKEYPENKISTVKCLELIKNVFNEIKSVLDEREIHFYIFPTISNFTINKMGGSGGVLIWKNVIFIDVFPKEGWEKSFKNSIVHEVAHALSPYFDVNEMTIGEGLVFDGIAEHFKERFIDGKKSNWIKALSNEDSKKLLLKIRLKLDKKDHNLYNELFYGTGKYPLWTGYTIGYYLIKEYLKKQKEINWEELLRKNPREILENYLINC